MKQGPETRVPVVLPLPVAVPAAFAPTAAAAEPRSLHNDLLPERGQL